MDEVIDAANDSRNLPDRSVLETDVCVVGAGPAGISIALELARRGIRVLLLDAGGRTSDRSAIRLARAESVGHSYFPVHKTRAFGFGGTSRIWIPGNFRAAPLAPLDFEKRPEVPFSGWPITRKTIDPYYERAAPLCGIGGSDFSLCRWETPDNPALPLPEASVKTEIFQSADINVWRDRFAQVVRTPSLRLLLHARVVEISAEAGTVRSLLARTAGGNEFRVFSRATVLAAGGLENPRLLLLSRNHYANGIGNQHDLVGRFFQEHLALSGGLIEFRDLARFARMGLYQMHQHPSGAMIQGKLRIAEGVLRREGLLGCAFFVRQVSPARTSPQSRSATVLWRALSYRPRPPHLREHAGMVLRNLPETVKAAVAHVAGYRSPTTLRLLSEAEQAPNPASRVTLSATRTDDLGLPQARIDWRVTDLDRRSIVEAQKVIDRTLHEAGLGRLEKKVGDEPITIPFAGHWHHMGTTRMHEDPRQGVVDPHCRVHGISNLFIAGSSVFPTSGYANPTYTIVALALRLADHLAAVLPRL